MEIVNFKDRKREDIHSTMEQVFSQIDDYDEIVIIGKKKDRDGYDAFPSDIQSCFWWVGALEAVKRRFMDDYLE